MLVHSNFCSSKRQSQSAAGTAQKKAMVHVTVQPKLSIGQPNDKYEREADRVADQVVSASTAATSHIQKKTTASVQNESVRNKPLLQKMEDEEIQTKSFPSIMKMSEDELQPKIQLMPEEEIQPKRDAQSTVSAPQGIQTQIEQSKGGGNPLPSSTQSFMESRIGADFSNVKIHNDSRAHKLSTKLNAQAFAVGNNVFFNQGKYNPETRSGQHLLAHELTHTVQQGASGMMLQKNLVDKNKKCLTPEIPIEDSKVLLLIKNTLAEFMKPAYRQATSGEKINMAFGMLQRARELKKNHCDWNLAAAEHYMVMRVFSQSGNFYVNGKKTLPGFNLALTAVYNLFKSVDLVPTGEGPASPITQKAIAWAQQGTVDGTYFPTKYLGQNCDLYHYKGKIGKKKFSKKDNIIVVERKKVSAPSNASINMGIPRIKVQPVTNAGYKAFGRRVLRWVKVTDLECHN